MAKISNSSRIINALAKYDIHTFRDVIFHLPRRYLDMSYTDEFKMNTNEKVTLKLKVTSAPLLIKPQRVAIIRFTAVSESGATYKIVAYNQRYILNAVKIGDLITVYGTINLRLLELTVIKLFPRVLSEEEQLSPLYSLPSEVGNHEFIRIVQKALKIESVTSRVPRPLADKNGLISLNDALKRVHNPRDLNDVFEGLKALKYEEGLEYFIKLLLIKRANSELTNSKKTIVNLKDANEFVKRLPFKLTKDQLTAVREIGYDMNKETLMYRLLQGDVGSGKTVVSFVALYINYLRGAQGVLLAPTESLAKQHYETLLSFFKDFDLRIELLIGALTPSVKTKLKEDIQHGLVDIVVGTHALFSEDVFYPKLELVVIDEQHKFGVNQRNTLLNKGEKADLLLLSATPIPRTLANVIYGDMDISTIESFPHTGRQVNTIITTSASKNVIPLIDKTLSENRQVYIVAPKISFGDKTNVLALYERFSARYPHLVGMLHGELASEEKDAALLNFKSGVTPILVSTTVVEVGIDVKSAGLMIIYEPHSFGLSSLHQLRGRIGRDGKRATLCLVSEEEDNYKLEEFAREDNGFKIAELDLALRGPGELTGEKQSGMPSFMYLNVIKDLKLITIIKEDALEVINNPTNPHYFPLLKVINDALEKD
ncbi:MAG TPA: ATP-dependent DNA helicase RecG [Bacilli bacterium]|jgi:ATP-dependent DNA helicase RecG|nr:ATP-dependent DNA helicase RecG [Bacillota bacterium]HOE53755.1 ATP-dependent DNA helicase RecG [Bacilli bacterium]TAH58959.1 MAG: ATP-dependent DNA helicase RecG [Bacillota bacterium]HOQ70797.1 ATP-dependent DNA helicase RecG [Bacilli bacterium]HPK28555.1 ATP-dependent DNA helicase RecG [Bacilli bacterium]